ncbi:MAG: hypothetical protein J6C92_11920, partial [Bacteroidaceae bacterium]|nr:hypothetical protein [Bacteroidaceae bacterium]
MNNRRIIKLGCWAMCLLMVGMLFSCGSLRKSSSSVRGNLSGKDPLTYEERRKFDYFFLEAVRLKEKGDLDAAFEMYSHCLQIHPTSAVTLFELAKFYMFLGQQQKGEKALADAVSLAPENYWYKETLAAYYQNKGENEKAISVVEDMATQFPSRLEPLVALVDLYTRTKNYEQVIHSLNRLETLDGKSEQISMEKFRMYLAMDNREQAFLEIENLAKEYPYDMRYLTILGDVYMENGKPDEAYATYQKVLKEEPEYAPALLSMASYYEKQGQDSLYKVQLNSVLLNEKIESNTKMNLMRQLIIRSEQTDKDSTQIIGLFNAMLEQEQENADIAMLAAQYLLSKKMEEESKPVLRKVLELDPENKPAYLQLLSFAINKQDMDEVIAVCTPAVEYMPDALEFYYYLGIGHYQKEQKDEALEVFKKGVRQVTPQSDKAMVSDFYSIMGDLYHLKKMNAEAYAAYDSALVYKDDNIGALNNYAYYLSLEKKDLDKAEEMSYRTVKAEPNNATYLDTYAWILFEKGKYTEARIYIDQAIQHGTDNSSVVVEHCGDIYYHCGETDKALDF